MASRGKMVIMVLLVVVMVVLEGKIVNGAMSPSQCKEERRVLENACRPVIFGRDPSAQCCQYVRVTHVECVCPNVTPKLAALIGGVDRAIRKIQGCGRPVPHNFKCGSVTTP